MAAMTRTSTRMSARPPTRLNVFSSRNRRSLACRPARHLANLVEEHGAAVGGLEQAALLLPRIGERAALVTEQLALEQLLGQRGHRDVDERPLSPDRCCNGWPWPRGPCPVPVSPVSRTVDAGLAATLARSALIDCIAGEPPMMASKAYSRP